MTLTTKSEIHLPLSLKTMEEKANNNLKVSQEKNHSQENTTKQNFFLDKPVKKCKNWVLKNRLQTLIKRLGMSEADFYKEIGLSKQYWYMISWGMEETPQDVKIRVAKALDTDTSLIWQEQER